jgi:tetratricopeptide (TPR) repeat protein
MDSQPPSLARLRQDVEWALRRAIDPSEVLPMLHRLARSAHDGSEESVYAHRNLAELLVERNPWRAALHARRVLSHRPEDDRGWAMLGLCQTLLGNYRFAATAYTNALARAPKNPWYAHNLGHLLDVALSRPRDAIAWLKHAYAGAAWNTEIAASYAHALARAGDIAEAKKVIARAMKKSASRELVALQRWLEEGAPAGKDQPSPRQSPSMPRLPDADATRSPRSRRALSTTAIKAVAEELESVLGRGLASLPLDARQRGRARELARDALAHIVTGNQTPLRVARSGHDAPPRSASPRGSAKSLTVPSLAAAIAYAIVYVDHVPLTQAEVAACFRVSAASVRGRFGELRALLDLKQGDVRYATQRRR